MVGTPLDSQFLTNYDSITTTLKPLWTIKDFKDEKAVLKWMKDSRKGCEEFYQYVFQVQMDNLLIYKGNQWLNQDRNTNRYLDRQGVPTRRSPKVVVNDIYDYVEQWVSRLTRYKPAVSINPTNDEWGDVQDAKVAKMVLDHIWYERRIEEFMQMLIRHAKIFGEGYLWIEWNPNKGDLHPDFVAARQEGRRIPVLDEKGQPVLDSEGKQMFIDRAIRIGDTDFRIMPPWHVWDMPCRSRADIDWTIRWSLVDVETLKAQYPDKAKDIKADNTQQIFERYGLNIEKMKNEVVVYELYHRSTEFLDEGKYIKCTEDCVLECTKLPYNHGQIPYVRLSDIDIPDEIRGMSFIQNVFPMTFQKNALFSLIYKSAVLMAHPKWMVPDGAVEVQQLADQSTVVSYQGGVPPQIVNTSSIPMELFTHVKTLGEESNKLAGVYAMSRGEVPAGVRAGAALRVLEEQEDKRAFITATKFNNCVVDIARMTLAVAGDYYQDDDGRMARVVGKGNEYLIRAFSTSNLSKPYDVRIQNTSALSQSPSGRIQDIIDLSQLQLADQDKPGIFSRAEIIDFLDLEANEKMKDLATQALRCAEAENEDMMEGRPVDEPAAYEDLIAHWRVHRRPMQNRTYKTMVPPERRAMLEEHLMATEYLMVQKAMTNPKFAALLDAEPDFPCLFVMQQPTMGAMPGGPMGAPMMGPVMPEGTVPPDPTLPPPLPEGASLDGAEVTQPAQLEEDQPAPVAGP